MLSPRCSGVASAALAMIAAATAAAVSLLIVTTARPAFAGENAQGTVTETLRLKYIEPSHFITAVTGTTLPSQDAPGQLVLPRGIERLIPDETARTVTVRGTPEGLSKLREMARFMDVAPRRVRLGLRLLRYTYPAGGKDPIKEEIGALTTNAANNTPVNLTAFGDGSLFRIEVTPHVNGDNSVSLRVKLSVQTPGQQKPSSVKTVETTNYRRLLPGRSEIVTAISTDGPVESNGAYYAVPPESLRAKDKPLTVYYLEAAPQVLPPSAPAALETAAAR